MNTIKENKEITKTEARVIQYSKIIIAIVFGLYALTLLTLIYIKI